MFLYTAEQEKEHAEIFYKHLKELAGETIHVDGGYPVDLTENLAELLRMAQHNEYEEHDDVYKKFGDKAKEEGFDDVARSFYNIAEIEKFHGDRFGRFAEYLEQNRLYVSDVKCWVDLLKTAVISASSDQAPKRCPVCDHDQGYFIRLELSPLRGRHGKNEKAGGNAGQSLSRYCPGVDADVPFERRSGNTPERRIPEG